MKIYNLIVIIALAYTFVGKAQQSNLPLNHDIINHINRFADKQNSHLHTAIRPYNESELIDNLDSTALQEIGLPLYNDYFLNNDSTIKTYNHNGFAFGWKRGDWLGFQKNKFYIGINPIIDAAFVVDTKEKSSYPAATYGVQMRMHITRKLSLGASYRSHLSNEPTYIKEFAQQFGQLPGYDKVESKGDKFKSDALEAHITFTPDKHFSMQGGYGKNFFGDGYRSLLVSDNSSSYPYLLLTTNFWKIKYAYLLNFMQSGTLDSINNQWNYERKYGCFHYLSVDIAKWMQFGFFEGVVWRDQDSLGRKRGIELNYLNPLLFMRPIEFALGSPDNIQLGMNFKFKASDNNIIYLQGILDDLDIKRARNGKGFYRTKIAMQLGYKSYDIAGVKHLDLQTEFNLVRPFVYSHKVAVQNYANANMAIAHPLGANFFELLAILRYQYKKISARASFSYAKQGRDDGSKPTPQGNNIYISDYEIAPDLNDAFNQKFLQGNKTSIFNIDFRAGYMLNNYTRTQVEFFTHIRNLKNEDFSTKSMQLGIGLKTGLFNRYNDF